MNNKVLIGSLTVFAAIFTSIILLNFSKSDSVSDNYFERKFSENDFLIFDKDYSKLSKNDNQQSFYSGGTIVEAELKDNLTNTYNLIFTDFLFSKKSYSKMTIPIESNILSINSENVLFSCKNKLFRYEIKSNKTDEISKNNIQVSNLIPLEKAPNEILFFGEFFANNTYNIGFFILNLVNNGITIKKLLYTNNESFKPEIALKYSGHFQKTLSNNYAYTCEDNSKIFLFNKDGIFEKEFNTKDNTQLPNTFKDAAGNCYFSRNGSQYTNSGVLIDNKNMFVFAMTSPIKNKIIIDQYSKLTGKYIQSFKLNYKNYHSLNIQDIYIENDKILLTFESNYASFKFSRYNDGNFY